MYHLNNTWMKNIAKALNIFLCLPLSREMIILFTLHGSINFDISSSANSQRLYNLLFVSSLPEFDHRSVGHSFYLFVTQANRYAVLAIRRPNFWHVNFPQVCIFPYLVFTGSSFFQFPSNINFPTQVA
ncbi:hypothetical protein EGR_00853 [Echinococcus granulosus]|uniref:Uncharacterized protein n=1 Tax=Echinococcus granulosus TaxID=6210 RepID=W6VBT4_ECHGR|nr:hypothetical protein EGR_00853 [Echinococcus granulosus]EUB64309.1 hypothetical protein EGR_00853 [Echinococcus granulosus]